MSVEVRCDGCGGAFVHSEQYISVRKMGLVTFAISLNEIAYWMDDQDCTHYHLNQKSCLAAYHEFLDQQLIKQARKG